MMHPFFLSHNSHFAFHMFHFAQNGFILFYMAEIKNIGLYVNIDDAYTRGIVRGIIKYARQKTNWTLLGYDWMFTSRLNQGRNLDGIIARIKTHSDGQKLTELGVPVIDVADAYGGPGYFEVRNDDHATGVKAAYYLSQLGHSYFAWAGVSDALWSRNRYIGFMENIQNVYQFEKPLTWWEQLELGTTDLRTWLISLPKPVALFAANDAIGLKIIKVCRNAGAENKLSVPADIVVLGVDNEDILCELATPPLSSIVLNCEQIGFSAAALLEKLMNGQQKEVNNVTIPPLDICERESTRIFITRDELVSIALNFIANSAHTGITVDDVLARVPASRRNLEQRFKKITGKTLHEEIITEKVQYSKKLMRSTDASLTVIAEQSGFGSVQRFHKQFKESEGCTPAFWKSSNKKHILSKT
jgi:LacI family transcriptional regulator